MSAREEESRDRSLEKRRRFPSAKGFIICRSSLALLCYTLLIRDFTYPFFSLKDTKRGKTNKERKKAKKAATGGKKQRRKTREDRAADKEILVVISFSAGWTKKQRETKNSTALCCSLLIM